ncbi:MAG: hypothetical protein JWO49_51 [Arthrobacter sp.]|nr:hypothetical protein [Arthrobacter sp.]
MTQTPRDFDPSEPAPNQRTESALPGDTSSASFGYTADETAGQLPGGGPGSTAGAPRTDAVTAPPREDRPEPMPAAGPERNQVTRAGMVWVAVASALVVLILLIAFILQNQDSVLVKFFGLQGAVSLGIALFIAAVGGGVLVAIAGAARIIQLRLAAHRQRVKAGGHR